jgi:orotate phosphoribosyltransferase
MNPYNNPVHYRSIADLIRDLTRLGSRLPRTIRVVAGVPRSGMLAASMLALQQNLFLTDVDGLIAGRIFQAGSRKTKASAPTPLAAPCHVLVVDDSVNTGDQLTRVRERLATVDTFHQIAYAAAYVSPETQDRVDYFGDVVRSPRAFEWNLFHHPVLRTTCMDIDGVLCHDPVDDENDDGPRYERFLETARPYRIPSVRVGWLVTSRLEKYRSRTEAWLQSNGVKYDHLEMLDLPSAQERRGTNAHARFKADVYRRTGADLFVESCPEQALQIAAGTGWSVFCVSTGEMLSPAEAQNRTSRTDAMTDAIRDALAGREGLSRFVLIDDDPMGKTELLYGHIRVPFVERGGAYWGKPEDSRTAINELERLRNEGAELVMIAPPAFWWLDYYDEFGAYLDNTYPALVRTPSLIAFDLGSSGGRLSKRPA